MKSLGTRLAVVISAVLLCMVVIVGLLIERKLAKAIEDEGVEQAQLHAQTILGSLKTLMLNGNGTLARDWLDRLHGVAGIEDIEVLRVDGEPAFTDLDTVHAVNDFLGTTLFQREAAPPFTSFQGIPDELFQKALKGETVQDTSESGKITVAMPIEADVECLTCHGYESSVLRGVLTLSLDNNMKQQIATMRLYLFAGSLVLVVMLGLALWMSLKFNVLQPIETLRNGIVRVTKGEREEMLPVMRQDELGELASVFNQMQQAVHQSVEQTRAVMDNVVDGVLTMKQDGCITMVNPAVTRLFGYSAEELLGQHINILVPDSYRASSETILGNDKEQVILGVAREIMGRRKMGSGFPMEVTVSEMDVAGKMYYIATLRDITSRKARTAALRYQALHDALTDLPNRTLLLDRLQQALREGHRQNSTVALLLMDLDRFKEVNDTLGHHVGDKLLQQVAHRLRRSLRESDTVARLGGDEFSVLLPTADAAQAMFTARKIINAVEKPVNVEGRSLRVGGSIGIALFPDHGDNANLLMQRADVAMYLAKRRNKGFTVYDPSKDQHSLRQLTIATELKHAIDQDQLVLFYQPKVDVKKRRLHGVEALVRWQHPKHGLLLPEEFVPLAEQTGLIKPLTLWVFRRAIQEIERHWSKYEDMPVSVNLSALNLSDPGFSDDLAAILGESGVASERVKLEITETALMDEPEQAIRAMNRLKTMGLLLSIDDFGIGYSSLAYLKQLPVMELKIDKSFGLSLVNDTNSEVIVRSTIDLAHELGLQVVAEGVESEDAFRILERLGCDVVQGFFVARPMPTNDLLNWLEKRAWEKVALNI